MVDILGPRLVAVRCQTVLLRDRSLHSLLDSMDLISNRALPGLTTQWSDFRQRSGPKSASHSYYTPKIAFVKSYDAFFLLFFHNPCRSSMILFLFCSPNAAWLHFIRLYCLTCTSGSFSRRTSFLSYWLSSYFLVCSLSRISFEYSSPAAGVCCSPAEKLLV